MSSRGFLAVAILVAMGAFVAAQIRDPRATEVANFRTVTEEMLRNPPPDDWLNWRRTDNAWGYSPLERAVQDLRTARSGGSVEIVRVD